jgi:hypothetical protein
MNFPDEERHEALKILSSVGKTARDCLSLLRQQDETGVLHPTFGMTFTQAVEWQLTLSLGWHCLREGRLDQAEPFGKAVQNIRGLKWDLFADIVICSIMRAYRVHRNTALLTSIRPTDHDTINRARDRFPDKMKKELPTTDDKREKRGPGLQMLRFRRGKRVNVVDNESVLTPSTSYPLPTNSDGVAEDNCARPVSRRD